MNILAKATARVCSALQQAGYHNNYKKLAIDFIYSLDEKTFIECMLADQKGENWFVIKRGKPVLFLTPCEKCGLKDSGFGCFTCGDTIETTNFEAIIY